jgi:hypothetical protein
MTVIYLSQKLQAMRPMCIVLLIHSNFLSFSCALQSFANCSQAVELVKPGRQSVCKSKTNEYKVEYLHCYLHNISLVVENKC